MLIHTWNFRQIASAFFVALALVRFIRVGVLVARGKERWTQFIVPLLVMVELSRLMYGSATRMSHVVLLTGAELLLALGCVFAFWRERGTTKESLEQGLYRRIRIFLPRQVSNLMTQEMMAFISCAQLFRKSVPSQSETPHSSFSYVQASPIRALPFMLAVGAVPEFLLLHFMLKAHPLLAAVLTTLAAWSVVWITGFYVSMRERPHQIQDGSLTLRLGIRRWCRVPLADIRDARLLDTYAAQKPREPFGDFTLKHCARMEILLARPAKVESLAGEIASVNCLRVTADDLAGLHSALRPTRQP